MCAKLHVISQEMGENQLVVKSSIEDFTTQSQLIVHETQEAVFFKSGQALDSFGPGRHTLTTENLPIMRRIFGSLFGGNTPFPCEVYFINKVYVLDVPWGTSDPIVLKDPVLGLDLPIVSNGQTGLRVADSRKFLIKIVGQLPQLTVEAVTRRIKGVLVSSIIETLSQAVTDKNYEIRTLTSHLFELEEIISQKSNFRLNEFGLEIDTFTINKILLVQEAYDKINEFEHRSAERRQITRDESFDRRTKTSDAVFDMDQRRYTYQEKRQLDILDNAAKNPGGSGGFINMGVGMGVGMGRHEASGSLALESIGQEEMNRLFGVAQKVLEDVNQNNSEDGSQSE
jgi:membrane protease subunit (stomatin/prohibitin family)